jgi:hypothetical protein
MNTVAGHVQFDREAVAKLISQLAMALTQPGHDKVDVTVRLDEGFHEVKISVHGMGVGVRGTALAVGVA